jgi:hypothetical protein
VPFILCNYVFQEAMLKAELRNMERSQKREGIDMTYLKNVVLKLLETGTRHCIISCCFLNIMKHSSPVFLRKKLYLVAVQ